MSAGSGSSVTSLHRTRWPLVAFSITLSACALLSKEQGVMAIGVCASYDIFVHWDEIWTSIFNTLFRKSIKKLKDETDVSQSSDDAKEAPQNTTTTQVSQTSATNRLNGMTSSKLCNGGSKVKSTPAAPNKLQKKEARKENKSQPEPKTVWSGLIFRIGRSVCNEL